MAPDNAMRFSSVMSIRVYRFIFLLSVKIMKISLKFLLPSLVPLFFITACSSDDNTGIDEEKPTISVNYSDGFPQSCAELVKGQTYNFRAWVTDNVALASYSLDIHENFDHHTHDDHETPCDPEPGKKAANPMIFMENYAIENGPTSYEIIIPVTIPNDIDAGDYHCQYAVTDQTGWQSRTSIDIKIVE